MFAVLSGVWIASVLGSPHCVGMCGTFVALAVVRRGPEAAATGTDRRVLAYNLGRLIAYTAIGVLAGGLGRREQIVEQQALEIPVGHPHDLVAGLQRHQHQLQIMPRVEHPPEIVVLFGQVFDIVAESVHLSLSFCR